MALRGDDERPRTMGRVMNEVYNPGGKAEVVDSSMLLWCGQTILHEGGQGIIKGYRFFDERHARTAVSRPSRAKRRQRSRASGPRP